MMKRGFIYWDKREVSEEDFQKRKERVLDKMAEEDLRYMLVYGDVWQCDDIQYLSNFNTYTRDCLLVLDRGGKMSLISSMTPRDREWIAGFTPVANGDIFFSAGLIKASDIMKKADFSSGRIGLVGHFFPKGLFEHLHQEFPKGDLIDFSDWFRKLRSAKDSSERALIKRAALLATNTSRALTSDRISGQKEIHLSAQAEWSVRSRGGEDYHFFCNSRAGGFLDFPKDTDIKDYFAFSLLTQYKGCWAMTERTWMKKKGEERKDYEALISETQKEGALDHLEKVIHEAKARDWFVEIKSPVGPDTPSSIIPGLERVPGERNTVFSLTFQKETAGGLIAYGETLYVGEEGYEVWTA